MNLRALLSAVFVVVFPGAILEGQSGTWAVDFGYSVPGGNQSLVAVANRDSRMTGADQAGLHVRGSFERRVAGAAGLRIEGFYNRLTSNDGTFAVVNGETLPTATNDQSVGLFAMGVVHTSRSGRGSPYLLLGGGPMMSRLHRDSSVQATGFTRTALGLGVSGGIGIAYRALGLTLRNEVRYAQSVSGVRGSAFFPLSVGVQF